MLKASFFAYCLTKSFPIKLPVHFIGWFGGIDVKNLHGNQLGPCSVCVNIKIAWSQAWRLIPIIPAEDGRLRRKDPLSPGVRHCSVTARQPEQLRQSLSLQIRNVPFQLGRVSHVCSPSTLGGRGRRITWAQEFKTSLGNMARPHLYKKIQNLAWHGGTRL